MEEKTEEAKKEEKELPVIEFIKIIYYPDDSKQANEMEEAWHVADIGYKCAKLKGSSVTEIRFRKAEARVEDLAHELGHFMQYHLEEQGYKFKSGEEISFLFEDAVRHYLRKILYPELK